MTPERFKQLRAMEQAATAGPWFFAYRAIHSKPLSDEYMRIERELGAAGVDDDDPRWDMQPESAIMFVPVVGGDTATARGAANGTFAAESRSAIPELLDEVERLQAEDAEWSKLCNQQNDLLEQKYAIKDPQLCGWCWRAAGDDDAAKESLPKYTIADVREHTLTCVNNPLVAERNALAARLAEAMNLDSRDAEIIAARSELRSLRATLAAMTAARDEACDLAEEANGDPSSCSYVVPLGERIAKLRKVGAK